VLLCASTAAKALARCLGVRHWEHLSGMHQQGMGARALPACRGVSAVAQQHRAPWLQWCDGSGLGGGSALPSACWLKHFSKSRDSGCSSIHGCMNLCLVHPRSRQALLFARDRPVGAVIPAVCVGAEHGEAAAHQRGGSPVSPVLLPQLIENQNKTWLSLQIWLLKVPHPRNLILPIWCEK